MSLRMFDACFDVCDVWLDVYNVTWWVTWCVKLCDVWHYVCDVWFDVWLDLGIDGRRCRRHRRRQSSIGLQGWVRYIKIIIYLQFHWLIAYFCFTSQTLSWSWYGLINFKIWETAGMLWYLRSYACCSQNIYVLLSGLYLDRINFPCIKKYRGM